MRYLNKAGESGDAGAGGGEGGGDTAAGVLDAARQKAEGGKGGGNGGAQLTAAEARTFLADYVPDPKVLEAMPEADVFKYHGRVKGAADKIVAGALSASALKLEQRPDWLPEQFYDPEKKTARFEAIVKSWKDTSGELKTLKGAKGAPPEKPEGYAFKRPEGLPAHLDTGENSADLKALRTAAHKAGMPATMFQAFADSYFTQAAELVPAPIDIKAEMAALGENAEAVTDAVYGWGKGLVDSGLWSQAELDEIIATGATASGLRALNKLREHYGGQPIPVNAAEGEVIPSDTELYSLVGTEKYQKDPAERARVTALFEKRFGTAPAGTSPRGLGA